MNPGNGEPFQDHEKRFILTEALRTSTIPIERLLNLLQEGGPLQWEDMLLPRGRTVRECKAAYDSLRSGPPPFYTYSAPIQPIQHVNPPKRKSDPTLPPSPYLSEPAAKRRQPGIETLGGTRNILPKAPHGGSPISITSLPTAAPTQKRRGRPPKQEVERKNREAMQRGELFPAHMSPPEDFGSSATSPYAPIAPTPPSLALGPPTPQGFIEHNIPDTQREGSPEKKKRVRAPAKPPKIPPPERPGESSFSVNLQIPVVREPQVRQQVPSIAAIAEMQTAPVSQPAVNPSVVPNPLPPTTSAAPSGAPSGATSAESQPPVEAAS